MVDNNPTASLARAYREMHPMQYLREMYYNAVEAGATVARLRPVNSIKMAFCDDGHGMNPEDLLRLINGRNSSTKSTEGFHGNFGVGLKDSALTPNPYGLVIASRTDTKRQGGMIWLHQKDGVSGAKMLISDEMRRDFCFTDDHFLDFTAQYGDELYSIDFEWIRAEFDHESFTICGVDWMRIFKDCSANTIVTMMGQSADDVTFTAGTFPIQSFMSSRLYTTSIKMMIPRSRMSKTRGVDWKKLHTVSDLTCPCFTQSFKDFNITTWIKPIGLSNKDSVIHSARSFMSAVRYNDELFNYTYDPSRAGKSRAQTAAKRWGLYYPKVFNRVIIIVEPPKYDEDTAIGCFPNSTRQELLWSDPRENIDSGKIEVPLREIQDWYIGNMPSELRELIQEEVQKTLQHVKKSKVIDQFRKFFKAPKIEKVGNANLDGDLFINLNGNESADQSSPMEGLFEGRESSAKVRADNESKQSQETKSRNQREGKDGDSSPADRRERRPSPKDASVRFTKPGDEVWATYESLAQSNKGGGLFPFVYTGIRRGENVNVVYVNQEAPIIETLTRSALDWVSHRGVAKLPMTEAECFEALVAPFINDFLPVTLGHLNSDREKIKLGLKVTDPTLLYAAFHGTWQMYYNLHKYYDAYRTKILSLQDGA